MGDELDTAIAVITATLRAGTPLVFAAMGELVAERAGVLNLGIEGMMLVGAVVGFMVAATTGITPFGFVAAALAGMAAAAIFGVLALNLMTNQVATGLALAIFGGGLAAFIGQSWVGIPLPGMELPFPEPLRQIPFVGPVLFGHDWLVYLSILLVAGVAWFLRRTRAGLTLRAVGENQESAHALGYSVLKIRWLATLFGGAMAGIGGGYLSLIYTPQWAEDMTAGRGWIALALVVFATWRPWRVLLGAYIFGGVTIIGLQIQAAGASLDSNLIAMTPYLATVVVLVLISRDVTRIRLHTPASLARPFHPEA
ncbi:MAG TPA: ABC transporter permease [Geminicoccus sp.]|jgi:simple sugar transport system permease protein|uniref:ABC transporter permease n=1 Tax=Geminicoccus sp. TaxID=2024832 RepID=UPI002E31E3A2|nr:ABC transporter permease [Geminicoccus sp.]HEX2525650.1 ABC transporter permease [Geminicoccus sp.]